MLAQLTSRPRVALLIILAAWLIIVGVGVAEFTADEASGVEPRQAPPQSAVGTPVTMEAYESALRASADCAVAARAEVALVPGVGMRPANLIVKGATLEDAQRAMSLLDACRARHSLDVEQTWWDQYAPAESDNERTSRLFADCMRAAGVEGVGDHVTVDQQRTWLGLNGKDGWDENDEAAARLAPQCILHVEEETGFRP